MIDPPSLEALERPPAILQIYRDPVKPGSEAAYRAVEEAAARICVELGCPHPHLAIESLTAPVEVWWLNAYGSEVEKDQVAEAHPHNHALMVALEQIAPRKEHLTGTPEETFARYLPDVSRSSRWRLARVLFFVATVTRSDRIMDGFVFGADDGRKFVLGPVDTRAEADALAAVAGADTRIFAVRPYWGMPAPEWIAADPEFWRVHPAAT